MSAGEEAGTAPGYVLGLDTGRRGETAQVEVLGRALGRPFRTLALPPDGRLPDAAGFGRPALILGFGRAAAAALALAEHWSPRPVLVQLGTPGHAATDRFDLVVPMPQDDYPAGPNVLFPLLPFNGATLDAAVCDGAGAPAAAGRSDGGTVVLVGGRSRHMRMGGRQLRAMVRFGAALARANGERLALADSPRTPAALRHELEALARRYGAALRREPDAFAALLRGGRRFLVGADSASMLAESWRTGMPVWLWRLPAAPDPMRLLQHACDALPGGRALRHALVRRGRLGGGSDFRRWHRTLERRGMIHVAGSLSRNASLHWEPGAPAADTDPGRCRARMMALLERAEGARTGEGG